MRHPTRSLLFAAIVSLACAGCGGGTVSSLDGALSEIPIFAPASFKERSTSFTSDDMDDPMKFSTYTWYLETEKTPAEVEAFYAAKWPSAGRTEDEESVTLRIPPFPADENAPLGESVSVTIHRAPDGGKTQFYLLEDVFRAKRP